MTIHTIEVVCTGTELLLGDTLNTNLAWLGQELRLVGARLVRETCVPDDATALADALRAALDRSDAVIVIGGLGPTRDDLTRPVAAAVTGCELVPSPTVAAAIRRFLEGRGLDVPAAAIEIQSEVLTGAEVLPNRNGTAPGFWHVTGSAVLVLLPGPPGEFRPLVRDEVLPRLRPLLAPGPCLAEIRAAGIPESRVAHLVEAAVPAGVVPAYCARPECILVRLEAAAGAEALLARAVSLVRTALAPYALPEDAPSVAAAVGQLLSRAGLTVATAESCTGGGIAAALTDVPGASAYFEGALVSYANRWKRDFLGVPPDILDCFGAVSEETVRAMLDGLLVRYGVDCGIAVSGVAGPGGGTPEKPVGQVVIGTAVGPTRQIRVLRFRGDRDEVRRRAVAAALHQVRMHLLDHELDLPTFHHS